MTANSTDCEVVLKRRASSYIYRLPSDPSKCYRFTFHADEFSMFEDPSLNHFEGCRPVQYDDVIKEFHIKENKDNIKGAYGFPLESTRGKDHFVVMYRIPGSDKQCFRFQMISCASAVWRVYCSQCDIQRRKAGRKIGCIIYKISQEGFFLDDPLSNHLPESKSLSVNEVMINNEIATKETGIRLLDAYFKRGKFGIEDFEIQIVSSNLQQNAIHKAVPAQSDVRTINDQANQMSTDMNESTHLVSLSGPVVIEKHKELSYFYRLPEDESKCYRFYSVASSRSNIALVCLSCAKHRSRSYKKGKTENSIQRKSDGFSMFEDPTVHHLPSCKPDSFEEVIKKYRIEDAENQENRREYDFSLTRYRKIGHISIVHRVESDPSKCYLFNNLRFKQTKNVSYVKLMCSTCFCIYRKDVKKFDKKTAVYRCNERRFLDDPSKNHLPGCEPILYSDVIREHTPLSREQAHTYFQSGKQMTSKMPKKQVRRTKEQIQVDRDNNKMKNGTITDVSEELSEDETVPRPNELLPSHKHTFDNIKTPDSTEEIAKQEPIDMDEYTETAKRYYHEFEVPFFNENEFQLNIENRNVTISFGRTCASEYSLSGSLIYSLQLPKSIDVSSIRIMWNQGIVELTAQYLE